MSTVYADLQSLEPGAQIELYSVDGTSLGAGVLNWHGYSQVGNITWKGVQYNPWPFLAEGFDLDPVQPPIPKITVGNVDASISALCLQYHDMVGATLTRHRTFGQYLDAVNFPGGVNPTADPTQELPLDIWIINRKASETSSVVQWELANPMATGKQQLPNRQIIANYCFWLSFSGYRGPDCGYVGPPVADVNDVATTLSSADACGGRLKSCQLRQWPNNELSFGSFPAAGLTRS